MSFAFLSFAAVAPERAICLDLIVSLLLFRMLLFVGFEKNFSLKEQIIQ
jgi:hypothetical protein